MKVDAPAGGGGGGRGYRLTSYSHKSAGGQGPSSPSRINFIPRPRCHLHHVVLPHIESDIVIRVLAIIVISNTNNIGHRQQVPTTRLCTVIFCHRYEAEIGTLNEVLNLLVPRLTIGPLAFEVLHCCGDLLPWLASPHWSAASPAPGPSDVLGKWTTIWSFVKYLRPEQRSTRGVCRKNESTFVVRKRSKYKQNPTQTILSPVP